MIDVDQDLADHLMERADDEGASAVMVKDGHILVLTTATLERLLEASKTTPIGKAVLFLKRGASA